MDHATRYRSLSCRAVPSFSPPACAWFWLRSPPSLPRPLLAATLSRPPWTSPAFIPGILPGSRGSPRGPFRPRDTLRSALAPTCPSPPSRCRVSVQGDGTGQGDPSCAKSRLRRRAGNTNAPAARCRNVSSGPPKVIGGTSLQVTGWAKNWKLLRCNDFRYRPFSHLAYGSAANGGRLAVWRACLGRSVHDLERKADGFASSITTVIMTRGK